MIRRPLTVGGEWHRTGGYAFDARSGIMPDMSVEDAVKLNRHAMLAGDQDFNAVATWKDVGGAWNITNLTMEQ
jgi:hypothetical protein